MSIFSSIGRTMNRLPGMSTFTRPVSNLLQKTPGMRGAPQALGMMPRQGPPIGPSPNAPMMQNMAQNMSSVGAQMMPQSDGGEAYGQGMPVTPMPPVPMGDQQGNFGSSIPMPKQGGGRFGMQNRNQQMMQKQRSAFKPQY